MKSGKCPKCGSTEVYSKKDGVQLDITYVLKFANVKRPRYEDYLCMNCGYAERYLVNLNEFQDLPKNWSKAGH